MGFFRSQHILTSLRSKLFLGYLVFIAALVALGTLSALELGALGGVSGHIITDNYASVVAAQEMKESLERQDSAALFALLGQSKTALDQMRENRRRFDDALSRAAANITEPGESDVIASISRDRDLYYQAFDDLLSRALQTGSAGPGAGRERYFSALEPVFDRLRTRCDELLQLNQRAMLSKSETARGVASRSLLTTLGTSVLLVIAGIALAIVLSGNIVRPVRELTAAAARVGGGDLDAVAPILSQDEVGRLAAEFNRMAAHLRELRLSDLGRLLVAQRMAEAAIGSLYDPVLVTDELGHVTRLNRAAEEIFGPMSGNEGKSIAEVTGDERLAMAVSETLSSQRTVAGEGVGAVMPLVIEGKEHSFRLRTTPLKMNDGRLAGAVALLEDITHLREIDRLKSEFVATASHELRTPLASLQMGVNLLLEGAAEAPGERQKRILQACREDCERLERLIRDLLELSRIEAGQQSPELVAISLSDLIESAAGPLRPQVESRDLAFRVELPEDPPWVLADRPQIERVLGNLVGNAARNTPAGGEVRISGGRRAGHAAVTVADTGRGIQPEYLPRIFDKFVQVPGSPPGGAGLGLAISKEIVEAHHGQISVRSEPGRGTVVTFTLPVAEASPARGPLASRKQEES